MKVLVAGGAGYIGAHVVRALAVHGQTLIILDDLRASSK
jgi:UDP-glucose 4-epimerase